MIWVSCERGLIKPDRRAFEDMFSMFNLKPQECFFIDDTRRNRYTDTINSYLEFMDEEDCLKLCKIIKIFAEHIDEVD